MSTVKFDMYDENNVFTHNSKIYELMFGHPENIKYRVIFNSDDYDYIVDEKLITELDKTIEGIFYLKTYMTGMGSDTAEFLRMTFNDEQKSKFIAHVNEVYTPAEQVKFEAEYNNIGSNIIVGDYEK